MQCCRVKYYRSGRPVTFVLKSSLLLDKSATDEEVKESEDIADPSNVELLL